MASLVADKSRIGDSALAARLTRALEGEVLFDAFSRGRYATDASIYQIEPVGVVVPKSVADIEAAVAIAGEEGVPVLARGGGTSQCGQTVGKALVVDTSKYLRRILDFDAGARRVAVEPGLVFDRGGMRRTWLRGRENVHKRTLFHVAGHNLGLLMRRLNGAETSREATERGKAILLLVTAPDNSIALVLVTIGRDHTDIPAFVVLMKSEC